MSCLHRHRTVCVLDFVFSNHPCFACVQPSLQVETELMRKARLGTVAEFLDEFERDVVATFPFHKYTISR